jgi:RNA polymerase sigma factor (sigma-70 family)
VAAQSAHETRPPEADRRRASSVLLHAHRDAFRRTAARLSLCADDADDAVQRAAEILLTKAPTLEPSRLVAWMHVVTRHEALAVRRERERSLGARLDTSVAVWAAPEPLDGVLSDHPAPDEIAERREQTRTRLIALAALKPHERLAIVLFARGYSYAEIAARCGWTHTKVNRCLAEGRERLRALSAAGRR